MSHEHITNMAQMYHVQTRCIAITSSIKYNEALAVSFVVMVG